MYKICSLLLLVGLLSLTACAPKTVVPPSKQAGIYFQEGEDYFEQGLYTDAITSWEKVRDSYYSPELNTLAELKIAEAYYLDGKYIEAAVAYEEFLKNHPDHPQVPQVLFQMGLCYIEQMRDYDQDQTATAHALNAFQTLKQRFPDYPRREEVNIYIDRCMNQLAANEFYIGRYYLKTKEYKAAMLRFEAILKDYPNYYERDKTYFYLGQSYLKNGQRDKAVEVFNRLFNEYPQSEHIISAQKFIEKNY